MKYIDAEKLLAEIKIIQQSLESRDVRFNQVKKIRTESLIECCKSITDVIDSLQQEQSEVDTYKQLCGYMGIAFMQFLGKIRAEGKMCLSNGECADIDKAFLEQDWDKLLRYAHKYDAQYKNE